jgi:hypothetical protein
MATIIALDLHGRAMMQRDMELIRDLLLEIRSREDVAPKILKMEGRDELVVGRHIEMLYQAGLIDGVYAERTSSSPIGEVFVRDLSWEGHDFIAALENQTVWGQIKQKFSAAELATLPLSIVKNVGMAILNEWAMQKAGLSGG